MALAEHGGELAFGFGTIPRRMVTICKAMGNDRLRSLLSRAAMILNAGDMPENTFQDETGPWNRGRWRHVPESRTGPNGFAIRCITALLTRHADDKA